MNTFSSEDVLAGSLLQAGIPALEPVRARSRALASEAAARCEVSAERMLELSSKGTSYTWLATERVVYHTA